MKILYFIIICIGCFIFGILIVILLHKKYKLLNDKEIEDIPLPSSSNDIIITNNNTTTTNNKSTYKSLKGNFIRTYSTPIKNTYNIDPTSILGKGSFGVVVIGTHKETNINYAIKIVNKSTGKSNNIERELRLLRDVDHPNIIRLFAAYDTRDQVCNNNFNLYNLLSIILHIYIHTYIPAYIIIELIYIYLI
jgi:hypothetical protein